MDTSGLVHEFKINKTRPVHPGRVLHIDGDFVAYYVSGVKDIILTDMRHNADVCINTLKLAAGAETVQIHITPTGSKKGNRHEIALLKPYQGNREGRVKPEHLEEIRNWLHEQYNAQMWNELEADDGMSISQYAALDANQKELSVICSKDKDLMIIPGLHLDWDTHEFIDVSFFGEIHRGCTKSGITKLSGSGFKFFCAQMLMGDPADNVSGIPAMNINGKFKRCGPVSAFEILKTAQTPLEALQRVAQAYQVYEKHIGFRSYKGNLISAQDAFASEAKLLWMRRYPDENDILELIRELKDGTVH